MEKISIQHISHLFLDILDFSDFTVKQKKKLMFKNDLC